jgi:hypothetical protein
MLEVYRELVQQACRAGVRAIPPHGEQEVVAPTAKSA